MQPHRPAIAVVTPSILTGLGLESILRRIIPMAEVEVYDRFERFAADRPDRFFHYFVNGTHIKEGCFRIFIHFSVNDRLKSTDRFLYRYIFSRNTGKVLCHMERLG